MGIASTIKSGRLAGGQITGQAVADFASHAWRDTRAPSQGGDAEAAKVHAAEFNALCELFQEV